ncbi:MAG TPA: NadS family protein [Anaerolineales bacterium]|nr:NadS family protein [Anaerolineales bacterium]
MKEKLFDELLQSVREGGEILRGKAAPSRAFKVTGADVKRIRASYQLSQDEFAAVMGISLGTLRNWEQGRRVPEGSARILLRVAEKHPEALVDVVRAISRDGSAVAAKRHH